MDFAQNNSDLKDFYINTNLVIESRKDLAKQSSITQQKLTEKAEPFIQPQLPRCESPPVDYAATTIQKYFRMWKARAAYEQAQMDRAQQETKLIYFGQQVHHYSNEIAENLRKNNHPISQEFIKTSVIVNPQQTLLDSSKEEKKKNIFSPQETTYYESMGLGNEYPLKSEKNYGNGVEIDDDDSADYEELNTPLVKQQLLADLEQEKRIYQKWWDIVDMQKKLNEMIHNKAKEVQQKNEVKTSTAISDTKLSIPKQLSPNSLVPNVPDHQRRHSRDYSPKVNIKITDYDTPKVQSYYFGQAPLQNYNDVLQVESRQNVANLQKDQDVIVQRQESLQALNNSSPNISSQEGHHSVSSITTPQNFTMSLADCIQHNIEICSSSDSLSHSSHSSHGLLHDDDGEVIGPFDFRKVLRKTNWDPTQTLSRHKETQVEQVDFRGVLRRTATPTQTILTIGCENE